MNTSEPHIKWKFLLCWQGAQKLWQKPGSHKEVVPEHFVSHHPGADDDTDSEEEQERIKDDLKQEHEEETVGEDKQKALEVMEESEET
jgi:hypothetical protein